MIMADRDHEILKDDVRRILNYLENDDKTNKKGLVQDFHDFRKDMQEFISSYKTEQSYKKGIIAGISFIGGALGTGLTLLIKHIW